MNDTELTDGGGADGGANGGADSADVAVFSEEERREIAEKIEAAAKRDPVEASRMPAKGETSRRGLFPLAVNAGALVVLAAGLFLIFLFHGGEAAEIREAGAILGITERKLIQEIRMQLNEKDAEIAAMNARIAEVDTELERLDSLAALTDEQRAIMDELHRHQDEYRRSLAGLQNERAQILAEARQKEAALYARLQEQQSVLESLSSQSREIQAAREELAKLSNEQEKAALAEKQINAYFTAASKQIQAEQYKEASETIALLREFLNTPSFQSLRNIQARRESDLAAVNALAFMAEALKPGAAPPAAPPPSGSGQAETALQKQLDTQNAALSEQEKTVADLRKELSDLQNRNAEVQRNIAERDRQIETLQSQNTKLSSDMQNLRNALRTLTGDDAAQ
jgi:DNA repair exonuclease SbcCD ATPase subunit